MTISPTFSDAFRPESMAGSAVDRVLGYMRNQVPYDYRLQDLLPLQLAAFNERLAARSKTVSAVARRVDRNGIDAADSLDEIVPFLFSNNVYKSYPEVFISKGRWSDLARWIDTISTYPVSHLDLADSLDIDDFLGRLHASGHYVASSSGTSGKCSLLPQSALDVERTYEVAAISWGWSFGIAPDSSRPVFMLANDGGPYRGSMTQQAVAKAFGRPDARYFLYDEPIRVADVNRTAALHKSLASGTATPTEVDALRSASAIGDMRTSAALERLAAALESHIKEPMIIWGQAFPHYALLQHVRRYGIQLEFPPDTVVLIGGGLKDRALPDGHRVELRRFYGDARVVSTYGQSEVTAACPECVEGHWHIPPTTLALLLDESGRFVQNRPHGQAEGRMAAFDIAADSRWGGFLSSDWVRINFSACECGLESPTIVECSRLDSVLAADDKLSCAGRSEMFVRGVVQA